jgi:hypothetical protein
MTFKSAAAIDGWRGAAVCGGIVLLIVLLLAWLTSRPVSGLSFVLALLILAAVPVLGYIGFRTLSSLFMEYWVDRDGVTVVWGPMREIIPIGSIERIQRGGFEGLQGRWWEWPNPYLTEGAAGSTGPIHSLATRPAPEQVVLVTGQAAYALSPRAPDEFITALQARHKLGPARLLKPERHWPSPWRWDIWRDRLALAMLGLAVLVNLLLFGYLCFRYPQLPANLPLHFDAQGQPDRYGSPASLFVLPLIGLGALVINGLWGAVIYRRHRTGSYLLWGGALVVQLLVAVALINLVRGS